MNPTDGLSLKKNMLWNSIGSLVYLGCNWLTTILVVLLYPTYEASGCLASAMAVGNVVATIVLFKVRAFQVSDIKKEFSSSDYIALRIICAIAGIVFSLIYSLITVSSSAFEAAIAYSVFKILDSFVDVFHGIDQCHNRLDIAGISQMARGMLVLICFAGISVLTNDLTLAISAMALATLLIIVLFDVPFARKFDAIHLEFNTRTILKLIIACAPGFASSVLATLVVSLSRQLFGLEFGTDQLGIYAAIATPAVIVQAMASYIYAPLLGPIAIASLNHEHKKIKIIIGKFFAALAVLTVFASAFFLLLGEPLFALIFGPNITPYVNLIQPVLLSTSITAAELFVLDILIVFRKRRAAILTCFLAFAVALLSIIPLSHALGMNGISVTICIAYSFAIIASIPAIRKSLKK